MLRFKGWREIPSNQKWCRISAINRMEDGLCSRAFTKLHSKLWECIFEHMKHLGVDPVRGQKNQGQPVRAKKSIQKGLILQSRKARGIIFIYNHIMILCNLPVVLLKLKDQNIFKQYTVGTPCIGIHRKKSAAGTSCRASPTSPKKRSKI